MKVNSRKAGIWLLIILVLITFTNHKEVYAGLEDNVGYTFIDDYDLYIRYQRNALMRGVQDFRVTADLSNVDEILLHYSFAIGVCCENMAVDKNCHAQLMLNGNTIYYDTEVDLLKNIYDNCGRLHTLDVRDYKRSNAVLDYELLAMPSSTCRSCGKQPDTTCAYNYLTLVDRRAKVTSMQSNISVSEGEMVTISPEFNDRTKKINWAVKYPNEPSFTKLKEGKNAKGLMATGVNSASISLSNIPAVSGGIDIGVFVYDEDGNLPAGTDSYNTPFVTHVDVSDTTGPQIDVKKTIDKENGKIVLTITGSDTGGLDLNPYSFDGGNTFVSDNSRGFTEAGKYVLAVRDAASNITYKEVYIDAIDIEKIRPKSYEGTNETVKEKESDTQSGSSGTRPGGDKNQSDKVNDIVKDTSKGSGTFSEITKSDKDAKVTEGQVSNLETLQDKATATGNKTLLNKSDKSKTDTLKPKDTSDKNSKDTFEKIRKNSEDYIVSMREITKDDNKAFAEDKPDINIETLDESSDENSHYEDANKNDNSLYKPGTEDRRLLVVIGVIFLILILMMILAFVLYFGVVIFVEKETEYSKLSDIEGFKVPVAVSFVFKDSGEYAVCFRELLDKYGVVYARFGALFTYMYEGEKVKIMTKFKGENKREIAKERISKEIVVGSLRGKKK